MFSLQTNLDPIIFKKSELVSGDISFGNETVLFCGRTATRIWTQIKRDTYI
jgi:hypothetical protein